MLPVCKCGHPVTHHYAPAWRKHDLSYGEFCWEHGTEPYHCRQYKRSIVKTIRAALGGGDHAQ